MKKAANCDGKTEIVTEIAMENPPSQFNLWQARHNYDGQIVMEHDLSQFLVTDNCDGDFSFFVTDIVKEVMKLWRKLWGNIPWPFWKGVEWAWYFWKILTESVTNFDGISDGLVTISDGLPSQSSVTVCNCDGYLWRIFVTIRFCDGSLSQIAVTIANSVTILWA